MSVGDPRWPRVSPSGAARPSASGRVLRLSRVTRVRGRCERDTRRRSAPTPASRRCGMEICTRRARSGEVTSGPARCGQPASQAENCAAGAPIRGGAVSLLTSRRAMSPTDCWLPRGTPQPARPPLVQRRRRSFPGVGRGAGPDVTPASGAAAWRFAHAALAAARSRQVRRDAASRRRRPKTAPQAQRSASAPFRHRRPGKHWAQPIVGCCAANPSRRGHRKSPVAGAVFPA
jgi:hypothetical protein